jgi:hypothetical protein
VAKKLKVVEERMEVIDGRTFRVQVLPEVCPPGRRRRKASTPKRQGPPLCTKCQKPLLGKGCHSLRHRSGRWFFMCRECVTSWRENRTPPEERVRSKTNQAIHRRLRLHYPPKGICDRCGSRGPTEYALQVWPHPYPHPEDRDLYEELCLPCHHKQHRDFRSAGE